MNTTIISMGRCVEVIDCDLRELRALKLSWFAYIKARLTIKHVDAVKFLTRFRRKAG